MEKTIEDGFHTVDIYNDKASTKKVSTKEFAEEVVARLGKKPTKLKVANYKDSDSGSKNFSYKVDNSEEKTLVGVDIFVDIHVKSTEEVVKKVSILDTGKMVVKTISSKGLKGHEIMSTRLSLTIGAVGLCQTLELLLTLIFQAYLKSLLMQKLIS